MSYYSHLEGKSKVALSMCVVREAMTHHQKNKIREPKLSQGID